jgi:pimeloyl-ACP methyl ester carboxylesterase
MTSLETAKTEAGISHRFVEGDGVRLHCAEAGAGKGRPLVVLLHGFPAFWWCWREQMTALADAGLHVVAPDLRGYNLSDKPPHVGDYRIETVARDIAALVPAFGRERAVVVGHDWGGGVAWQLAMSHPDRVERLAIVNCPHPTRFLEGMRRPRQMRKSWYIFLFQLPWLPERLLLAKDCAALRRFYAADGFSREEAERYVEAFSREGVARSALAYYRAALRASVTRKLPPLRPVDAPVLVIWGADDRYLGREMAMPEKRWAPNARLELLQGSGHWPMRDATGHLNELLVEYAADLKAGRPS